MPVPEPRDPADPTDAGEQPVAVLVVDDQESFRAALRDVLAATEGFLQVGEAASAEEALAAIEDLSPQLVLIDKRMPGMSGVEAAGLITSRHPEIVVVIVSVEAPEERLLRSSGAAAFVRKQTLSPRLIRELWREHGG